MLNEKGFESGLFISQAQKDMLTEVFKKDAAKVNKKIKRLTEEIEVIKNQGQVLFSVLPSFLGSTFGSVLTKLSPEVISSLLRKLQAEISWAGKYKMGFVFVLVILQCSSL